jgi:membrane associated rhomboid family serine protease
VIVEIRHPTHIQEMTYDDFEQRVLGDEIGPEAQVRFEVVTGESFQRAGDLEFYQALADAPERGFRRALQRTGMPIVTAILVGFQVRVYLWSWIPGVRTWLQEHFTNWTPAAIEQGEVWRLYSYGLLHVALPHLLLNLCFLAYTAYHLERAFGRANLALLYFASVFGGGLLSMALTPNLPALGASGGVYGLLAASIIFGWKYWESIPQRSRMYFGWAIAVYLGLSFVSALRGSGVDHWSHMGGMLIGGLIATFIEPDRLTSRRRVNRRRRQGVLAAMIALSLGILGAGTRLVPLEPLPDLDEDGWTVSRPTYWRQGWTFTGDRGWFSPTLLATFAATTTVHPRPITADEAARSLIGRISSGSRNPRVVRDEPVEIDGRDGRELVLRFDLSGEEQEVTALVVARGVYEHRVQFQSVATSAERYHPLVEHIEESVRFEELPALTVARRRAQTHPRSPGPAIRLGDALYRSGEPTEALAAYQRARSLRPTDADALVGILRVHAEYGLPGGRAAGRTALDEAPDSPRVIVAAAEAIASEGTQAEAEDVLDAAWARLPGDRQLRVARLNWGLSVELPDVE